MQSEDLFPELATPNTTPAPAQQQQQQPEPVKKASSVPETQLSVPSEVNSVPDILMQAENTMEPPVTMAECSPRKARVRLCNLVSESNDNFLNLI